MLHPRKTLAASVAAAAAVTGALLPSGPASATSAAASHPTYQISIGAVNAFDYPDDTPASAYVDSDGSFHFQESYSLYAKTDPRAWEFYKGTNFDDAVPDTVLNNAVNPADPQDKNNDTTSRCNNSPTGLESTYVNNGTGYYSQRNFCDLSGTWVDPDTGDWYGLVHNEFTPQPFGDGLHYDAIDYAVSHDKGKTWSILGHAITSPYSTTRGDTKAFPNQTYNYGDGDQRLFVDYASGYFYVYYGSRVVNKPGTHGKLTGGLAHVARAPIAGKMAAGTWQKWYNGTWTQPGIGGLESNMEPVDAADPAGYTAPAKDYNPANTGTADQQMAAGTLPGKSPLFIMNITYDAYLGLYIGEPETVGQTGKEPQQFYATDDLATQKWRLIGDSGSYVSGSWYRWFADNANKWSPTIVGKTFRSYCSIACATSDGEYADVTIGSSAPAAPVVDPGRNYVVGSGNGRVLAQTAGSSAVTSLDAYYGWAQAAWTIAPTGDGSYTVVNADTGDALGVDSSRAASRAWGTAVAATPVGADGPTVGQEWFAVPNTVAPGSFRLVNRYSGLALGMVGDAARSAETTPVRSWTDASGSAVGAGRQPSEQTLTFTPAHPTQGPEVVHVVTPGNQSGVVGTPVSVDVSGTDSKGRTLGYSASGLPAGVSIDAASGVISGTPTAPGTSTVTVTASSGHASASATFAFAVSPKPVDLSGVHTLAVSGMALQTPNGSKDGGDQLVTGAASGAANQKWTFARQTDGSYTLTNGDSGLCADDNGGFTAPGTAVIQWDCSGASNQRWTATQLPSGLWTLKNNHTGLLMTAASTADGASVTQEADTGAATQRWALS
ncbi:RICIN domain-containing protein [Catenulispora subtropica]|uniref:Ricin B lectin domain-containing protein n=1 Tax=Catenulispora subtropica TaxID=450798 RepID=A0ABN2RJ25_9ACTN